MHHHYYRANSPKSHTKPEAGAISGSTSEMANLWINNLFHVANCTQLVSKQLLALLVVNYVLEPVGWSEKLSKTIPLYGRLSFTFFLHDTIKHHSRTILRLTNKNRS
jgi:hypothetical protein